MNVLRYMARAVGRARSKGVPNTLIYSLHVINEALLATFLDVKYGHRICTTNLMNSSLSTVHTMVHSHYHILRDIFTLVPISPEDVLVDVGCGQGRVINFWLSLGLQNRIIGLELNEAAARSAQRRYRRYPNVTIIQGEALHNMPEEGTLFFLYNPFPNEIMRRFEPRVRRPDTKIIYYQDNYLEAFENGHWTIRPLQQPAGRIYEFTAAVIAPRTAA